jgi:hypothetical protein
MKPHLLCKFITMVNLPHHQEEDIWFDGVHYEIFSMKLLDEMLQVLGYKDRTLMFTHFRIPGESLDVGLLPLMSDKDAIRLMEFVPRFRELELYIKTGVSLVECHMMERMMSNVNDVIRKDLNSESGNSGKLSLLERHKTSQHGNAGPVDDTNSDNEFPPT